MIIFLRVKTRDSSDNNKAHIIILALLLSSNRGSFHAAKKYHIEVASVYTDSTSNVKTPMNALFF